MKKPNFNNILLYSLLFVSLLASCRNKDKKQDAENQMTDYKQLVEKKIAALTQDNTGRQLANQAAYFGVDSLDVKNMKQIAGNHLLFFYFSNQTCPPCIQQTVDYIKEVFPDYEKDDRIIFISPDYPSRFRRNCYGKKLLVLETESLDIPLEKENVPFIFTLNENLEIASLHVVNKNDFERTLDFLKGLKAK